MSIQADIIASNRQGHVFYIVQVKDPDGYTDYLKWEQVAFTGQRPFDLPWTPQKQGRYLIQVFAWDSLSTPRPLSKASARLLDVSASSSAAPAVRCEGAAVCFSGKVTKITDEAQSGSTTLQSGLSS